MFVSCMSLYLEEDCDEVRRREARTLGEKLTPLWFHVDRKRRTRSRRKVKSGGTGKNGKERGGRRSRREGKRI